jgi:hypothetical protein
MTARQPAGEMGSPDPYDPLAIAKTSGFPLQLSAADVVSRSTAEHGWSVCSEEHPWSLGEDFGYADLVLENPRDDIVRMVVECKKRKGELVFINRASEPETTTHSKSEVTSAFTPGPPSEQNVHRP